MNWTEQQKKAIEDRDSTLLVSAAAGSGKTAVLVERIRRLVMDEGVDIDRMLIVTFTRAAAGEMKEKIYKALSRALNAPDADAERRRLLRRQLSLISKADICTFDQFALEIVHRYYHVAGLSPGIGICDGPTGSILRRKVVEEMTEELLAADDRVFTDFLRKYSRIRSTERAMNIVESFYTFLQSLPDPDLWTDWLIKDEKNEEGISLQTEKLLDFSRSQALLTMDLAISYFKGAAELLAGLPKLRNKIAEDISAIETGIDAIRNKPESAVGVITDIKWQVLRADKTESAAYEDVRDRVGVLRNKGKKLRSEAVSYLEADAQLLERERKLLLPAVEELCRITKDYSDRYLKKKLEKNILDFSDVAHIALRILDDEQVCGEYRKKFRYIFVDEYQDSNLVQDSLIQKIASPDNCFMVGDVKQSIYKFRLAEPELFLEKYSCFKKGLAAGIFSGRVIDLNRNFRSKSAVIEMVNRCFSGLMTEKTTGIVYDGDAALVEGVPYIGPLSGEVRMCLADSGAEDDTDPEIAKLKAVELEALLAAKLIKEYRGRLIRDDAHPDGRPLEYADMVILMRSVKNRAEIFYRILTLAGIPVILERDEGYFDTVEIRVFVSLLKLIDNRRQDIPLLSVLHFPVFGFDADSLGAVRVFSRKKGFGRIHYNDAFRLYAEDGPEGELKNKCRGFLEKLEGWRTEAAITPLGDFLWNILCTSGIGDFVSAIPGGGQRMANLRALAEKAENYEAQNAGGLHGFISYLEMLMEKGKADVGQAKILAEGTDAVRIMTIHKSKGLEFPFVLLASTASRFRTRTDVPAYFHKDMGVAMNLADPDRSLYYKPYILRLISERGLADELAERVRLLYVAMTRPKDILIMTGAVKDPLDKLNGKGCLARGDVRNACCQLDMLLPFMKPEEISIFSREELSSLAVRTSADRSRLTALLQEGFPEQGGDNTVSDEMLKSLISFIPPTPPPGEKRKYSVSQLAEMAREGKFLNEKRLQTEDEEEYQDIPGPDRDPEKDQAVPMFMQSGRALTGAEKGTAYHTVMEHIPFTAEGKSPEEIAEFCMGLRDRNILSERELSVIEPARISAFFRSSTGRRAMAASELRREIPFTLKKSFMGREIMVQGTIDCCFIEDGKWILVDYKSNYVDKTHLEESLERLRQNYLPQLALYKEALEIITGIPVHEGVLYLFGIDGQLSVT